MEQNIRSLQLMMETDLEDFYCENENYAFGMQFVAFLRDELELPLVCTLCLKVGNLSNILGHVNSIGHQVKVLVSRICIAIDSATNVLLFLGGNYSLYLGTGSLIVLAKH